MKTRIAATMSLFCVALLLAGSSPSRAGASLPYTCSNATLRGTYGTEMRGSVSPDGVAQIPIAEVGFFRLDGDGHLVGDDTLSAGGTLVARTITGTYSVARDCHATFLVTISGDDVPSTLSGVVVDGGSSTLLIQTTPGATVSGRSNRILPSF